jgi:uncharacterized membrane protein YdjX (TVP38/TMEM64 family)
LRRSFDPRHAPHLAKPGLVRIAIETRVAPAGGAQPTLWRWPDVLEGEPPRGRGEGPPPSFCVLGPELLAGTVRVENPLLVSASPEGLVEIEDRLCVTSRALAGAIATERAAVGARLDHARRLGAPRWLVHPVRAFTRGVAAMPDRVGHAARRARLMLRTPEGRSRLVAGLRNPHQLDPEQKAVTLFAGTVLILATLLLAHLAVTLAAPALAGTWRAGLFLFLYGYVSSLGIPFPWEPALLVGAYALGPVAAIAVAVAAKLVAGYMVFFVGDEVADRLERKAARSPWWDRFLRASEAFARRFGLFAMALFIATPGLPDAVALYVFGSLHMPMRRYLLGIALGALVLDAVVVYGGLRLLHLA